MLHVQPSEAAHLAALPFHRFLASSLAALQVEPANNRRARFQPEKTAAPTLAGVRPIVEARLVERVLGGQFQARQAERPKDRSARHPTRQFHHKARCHRMPDRYQPRNPAACDADQSANCFVPTAEAGPALHVARHLIPSECQPPRSSDGASVSRVRAC